MANQPRVLAEHPIKVYEPSELGLDDINLRTLATTSGTKVLVAGYNSFQITCKVDVSATSTLGTGDVSITLYAPDQTTAVYAIATVFAADIDIKTDHGFSVSIGGEQALAVTTGTAATVSNQHFNAPFMMAVDFDVSEAIDADKTGTANLWLTCKRQ